MATAQKIRRVYEYEPEYESRVDIQPEYDDMVQEWFKVIVTETDAELELRLTKSGRERVLGQIEKIRSQLNGLENKLDIFNTYGLRIITENLDRIDIAMFSVALNQRR